MPKLKLGKAKTNHQRKPSDWEKHPVWINDLDEEDYDEEHEKPAIGVTNVNRDVLQSGLVTIALRLAESSAPACGYFTDLDGDHLVSVWIWHKNQWREPRGVDGLKYPLRLTSVPTIRNKPAEFVMKKSGDSHAVAVAATATQKLANVKPAKKAAKPARKPSRE
jgi:hypothetical protein